MILATQHALRVPVSKKISSHLHVLSNVSVVPISCAEQSLDFPFSSAFLIGGTSYLYYRSSQISLNWAGNPLRSLEIMLNYIRGTSTQTGLTDRAACLARHFRQD